MNVKEMINSDPDANLSEFRQVKIAIGGDGKQYVSSDPHFEISGVCEIGSSLILLLPDTVAEFYRREGRRQLQAEFRSLMNVGRA